MLNTSGSLSRRTFLLLWSLAVGQPHWRPIREKSMSTDVGQPSEVGQRSANRSDDRPFTVAAPRIELPKGGCAIRGIGEKFAANPVTGTGSTTVPIATSPGRAGFGPQLALSYDSGSGNG